MRTVICFSVNATEKVITSLNYIEKLHIASGIEIYFQTVIGLVMNGIVGTNVAVWFHLGPLALTGYYLHPMRIHCVGAFVGSAQRSGGPNLFITESA